MGDLAKLFKSGDSQAVRLPKKYRFQDAEEVLIYRQGRRIILEPMQRSWSRRFLALAGSAPDLPYPEEPPAAEPGPKLGRYTLRNIPPILESELRRRAPAAGS